MTWLRSKRVLSDRQLSKIKTSLKLLAGILCVQAAAAATEYWYNGEYYEKQKTKYFPRGRIVEYTSLEEFCDSYVVLFLFKSILFNFERFFVNRGFLLPGITTMSRPFLAILYLMFLIWMFMGMNIIADVFME